MMGSKTAKQKKERTIATFGVLAVGSVLLVGVLLLAAASTRAQTPTQATPPRVVEFTPDPQQVDLISGQNKPGPYVLAYTNLKVTLRQKIDVVVNGRTLTDEEYTVDVAKGILTFKQPLKSSDMARVAYYYDAKTAKRNADFTSAPLTLPQMNVGGTSFKLTALSGATTGREARMVYGAERKLSLLGGGLSSSLLLTSGNATSTSLGYTYGTDKTGLDAQFQRTEKDFASKVGKSLGAADALQKLSVGARLRPANWFGTNITRLEQKDLNAGTQKEQTAYGLALGGGKNLPVLNVGRTEDQAKPATGEATTVTTEKVDLAASLGSAALTAKQQKVDTDAPDTAKDTTVIAQEAGLNLALNKTSSIAAKTVKNTTEVADPKQNAETQEASIALNAATKDKKTQAALAVTTGQKETATGVEEKQNLSVKLQPAPILTLAAEQKTQKTTPLKDGVEGEAKEATVQSASAELSPLSWTKFTGGVQVNEQGETKTSLTNLDATLGAGKAIEIGGGVTNRSTTDASGLTLDTTRARLALRPVGALTLTGAYIRNPEKDGKVSQAVRQEIGMKAKLGFLELGSGYALTTMNGVAAVDDDPQFGEISVTLGMRLSRFTKLDGSYKDGLLYGGGYGLAEAANARGSKVYTLGLTHVVGSALSFTMGGSMASDYAAKAGTPTAYKAEAKLGVKF